MSHIAQIRREYKFALDTALYLLRKKEDYHFWLRVELGLEYIDRVLQYQGKEREHAIASSAFWNWWHNEWFKREVRLTKQLVLKDGYIVYFKANAARNTIVAKLTSAQFEPFYLSWHNGLIQQASYPDRPVLEGIEKQIKTSSTII